MTNMRKHITEREYQIFMLTGQRWSAKSIAERLDIDPGTVDGYRHKIRGKLGLMPGASLPDAAYLIGNMHLYGFEVWR